MQEQELAELKKTLRHDNCLVFTYKVVRYCGQKHPMYFFLWIFGLVLLFFVQGPQAPKETINSFQKQMEQLEGLAAELRQQQLRKSNAYNRYYESKGWLSCDDFCQSRYNEYLILNQKYEQLLSDYTAKKNSARQIIGFWSTQGVEEAKNQFWSSFQTGKEFGKSLSWYDMIFGSISFSLTKDESLYEFFLKIIFQIALNFVYGAVVSIFSFIWNIGWLIYYYSTGPVGLIFFGLAVTAGISFLGTYVFGIFLAIRGVVNISLDIIDQKNKRVVGYREQHLHHVKNN